MDNRGRIRARLRELLKRPWLIAFLLFTGYLLTSTLLSRSLTNPYKGVLKNLLPGVNSTDNREIVENILLFIPYSFLMLQAFKPKKPFRTAAIACAGTTAFIEVSQLLFWLGQFQLADLIYNFLGGMLGWVLWALFHRIFDKDREQNT